MRKILPLIQQQSNFFCNKIVYGSKVKLKVLFVLWISIFIIKDRQFIAYLKFKFTEANRRNKINIYAHLEMRKFLHCITPKVIPSNKLLDH